MRFLFSKNPGEFVAQRRPPKAVPSRIDSSVNKSAALTSAARIHHDRQLSDTGPQRVFSQDNGRSRMSTPQQTIEQRLRLVEDKLAIYHLIASHPPAADTGDGSYYRNAFTGDGTVDLDGGKTADGNAAIASVVARPEHQAAIAGGLCHFAGLPPVEVNGDPE